MSEGLLALAREALARRDEEPAIAALEAALGARGDARLWHALGELHRARDDSAPALDAMARAAELAPEDAAIAARRAAFARDAGIDAVALTRAALALAPAGDETRLGLAEALVAQAQVERAEAFVAGLLVDRPGWSAGQAWLARSRWMSGDPAPLRDLDAALLRQPSAGELWRLRIMLAMQAGDFAAALAVLDRAEAAIGPAPLWLAHRAACLDELGRTRAAAAAFAALGPPGEVGSA
ncbi:MAG: tetratricopeptide repeat protein, partial [Novosphingobium sp.]